ncbi:MAG: putative maltokinase, partial [Gammaproteobacteria bacterium]
PYLVERDGTTCENLPETHAVIRRIRQEIDKEYFGRMVLAEANQWPIDVRPYFGDGDECHMAFHFPLMPRMYMAIAQEDRHPITDIMRQTPRIPANCQWAIFLRNHDELTLEMVTDRERDYLWEHYAADRRMRINLGIRRRLAPLMDNDRSRIELMNALLFSMPGTPVLYYGDEIGMGDNVFLGDRDGVRTPMQWSPDRNAGFSRADPAALYLPPVMNAEYGYEAINVETQRKISSSLLNWMRRVIAVRNSRPALGRGTQRFLFPRNRHVLVYLREHEGVTILCVFNLGRSAQAVELDLAEFRGRILIELFGRTPFPPIGERYYPLTLPGYGWFWFVLASPDEAPAWYGPVTEFAPEYVTLVVRRGLTELGQDGTLGTLEREVLPPWLGAQRWFAGKSEGISQPRIVPLGELRSGNRESFWLAAAEVTANDEVQRYFLPLGLDADDGGGRTDLAPYTLANVRRGATLNALCDATVLPQFAHTLLGAMAEGRTLAGAGGRLRFSRMPALTHEDCAEASLRMLGVEQSNTSVRYGEGVVLKVYRRMSVGANPELEMLRFLARADYQNTAPLLGTLEWLDNDGKPTALAAAYRYIPNQGDGWTYTLEYLGRVLEEAALEEPQEATRHATYLNAVARLGQRTAELHRALASKSRDRAFAPQPVSARDAHGWTREAQAVTRRAFTALRRMRRRLPHAAVEPAAAFLAREREIRARFSEFASALTGTHKIRVHGDLHLGQVLAHENDWYILDFEGEPERSLGARRAKRSPLKDVAGMLRSFDYAAATAAREVAKRAGHAPEALSATAHEWLVASAHAFLEGYLAAAEGLPGVPAERTTLERLLNLFRLEKALYEVYYEAANRPDWLPIPLAGTLYLLDSKIEL